MEYIKEFDRGDIFLLVSGFALGVVLSTLFFGFFGRFIYQKMKKHKRSCMACFASGMGEGSTTTVYAAYVHLPEVGGRSGMRKVTIYKFRVCHRNPLSSADPHISCEPKTRVMTNEKVGRIPADERDLARPYIRDLFIAVGIPNPIDSLS